MIAQWTDHQLPRPVDCGLALGVHVRTHREETSVAWDVSTRNKWGSALGLGLGLGLGLAPMKSRRASRGTYLRVRVHGLGFGITVSVHGLGFGVTVSVHGLGFSVRVCVRVRVLRVKVRGRRASRGTYLHVTNGV